MPTSASCRPSEPGAPAGGFTLLELLIVLALIGVTAAVVVPGLARTYEAIAASGERAEVVRALEALPVAVRKAGEPLHLDPGVGGTLSSRVELPEGWTVRLMAPLRIERTGYCHSSRVAVVRGDVTETWRMQEPACEVDDER